MSYIPYGRQDLDADDIQAVVEVLQSDFLTQGPKTPQFEAALAAYCGAAHACAVNSATSALHIACLALGVGPGDLVWTSPVTFIASANCARYCGADVDFVDIDARTYNMSVAALAVKLAKARLAGRLPKVVIPVHLCGQPCEMEAIRALSRQYGFSVIEDASHAIGGRYQDAPIGACRFSDICVFSFHPVKIITTAEGGAALTNNAGLAARMNSLRSHGMTRDAGAMTQAPDGPWYYEQIELGYNYRMTELQSALGLSQMRRLDAFVAQRHQIARRYDALLAKLPVLLPWQHADGYSGLHLYVVRLQLEKLALSHLQVFERLRAAAIGVNVHYIPVYRQPYYRGLGFEPGYCAEAESYYASAISLPMYSALSLEQQDYVVETLKNILQEPS
ncbi:MULTISPECIES: UDP-4-amino-4,6-dideoxy-N-acetyl-beta-L-altrosamine transaminase [unclassified Janthinobacterium]|uniref:UDP-4-amino-4, 6-dideoxy-N-acetyl-beta-L-altrosamine transaminase n=1 Tax=unclassified Janthinobacterium TaxID=2610881 RepID=UPI000346777C|nr:MULTISPECIES: UDP-4-amino-4,6-dideoxy-N-acetyl-beta-L-altrosamine transaminase [unclassified Janthinobacterium]MEC5162228.1 UDP-4-amino-4,6-dideoxy-N-acetyl-beta-L-altrosamine transaminase [Janthinobacterium sp. CG_S6]